MAHLSEVAFWRSTDRRSPDDFVRAIGGSILYAPETLIVMESTANGVGNYFHREWLRSVEGKGDKEPVFVAWHESELYELPVTDYKALWDSMDPYERRLWEKGCTLEQINWYHNKRREYPTHRQMMAEFPSDATEAFTHSESAVFAPEHVERLRKDVTDPLAVGDLHAAATTGPGALTDIRFVPDSTGALRIWKFPDEYCVREQRYVVGVDIGGVSSGSDWSVITVMDCGVVPGAIPEVVASWRGHVDHDILAWKCVTMALWYHKALLVIESNTLEHENTDGDPSGFILNRIADNYTNLYYRTDAAGRQRLPGMHINRSTKTWLITLLIAAVREGSYIERDKLACDELEQYERKDNGSFSARDGCHDDILMTRALILGALPARSLTPMHVVRSYYRRDGHRYVRTIEKSAVYGRYRIGK